MEFQRETGRIYAEKDGELIAEITFPEEDGVAVMKILDAIYLSAATGRSVDL